jgi:hypothetical protein
VNFIVVKSENPVPVFLFIVWRVEFVVHLGPFRCLIAIVFIDFDFFERGGAEDVDEEVDGCFHGFFDRYTDFVGNGWRVCIGGGGYVDSTARGTSMEGFGVTTVTATARAVSYEHGDGMRTVVLSVETSRTDDDRGICTTLSSINISNKMRYTCNDNMSRPSRKHGHNIDL